MPASPGPPDATLQTHPPQASSPPSSSASATHLDQVGTSATQPSTDSVVTCPICQRALTYAQLNPHLDRCLPQGAGGARAPSPPPNVNDNRHPISPFFLSQRATRPAAARASASQSAASPAATPPTWGTQPSRKVIKRARPDVQDDDAGTHAAQNGRDAPQVAPTSGRGAATTTGLASDSTARSTTTHTWRHRIDAVAPLAERLRPQSLADFVGQKEVVQGPLRLLLRQGRVPSMVLWGPPGSGKTTLARILARAVSSSSSLESTSSSDRATGAASGAGNFSYRFVEMSATTSGAVEIRRVVDEAQNRLLMSGGTSRTLLFVDEIQRWNRGVQDHLLPGIEKGTITVIGATTENPSFRLQAALLSRMRVFVLSKLSVDECFEVLRRARVRACEPLGVAGSKRIKAEHGAVENGKHEDDEHATGRSEVVTRGAEGSTLPEEVKREAEAAASIDDDVLHFLATSADGDARTALNAFELAIATVDPSASKEENLASVRASLRRTALQYDRTGDHHYDTISALHKSIRGSDADAAMYWLMRMVEAGDATATYQACSLVGMPECAENLASCVLYLAESPKSTRAYRGMKKARALVQESYNFPVPLHIRNAPTKLMKELDYAKQYRYEPSFAHPIHQEFFPPQLKGTRLLSPPPVDWTEPESPSGGMHGSVGRKGAIDMRVETEASKAGPYLAPPVDPTQRSAPWRPSDSIGSMAPNSRSSTVPSGDPSHPSPLQPPQLSRADGVGPGSCQRVFQVGARAVDLELLEEWERERNDGAAWPGRRRLMRALEVEVDRDVRQSLDGVRNIEVTQGGDGTRHASSGKDSAASAVESGNSLSTSSEQRAESSRRARGRFVIPPEAWRPADDLFGALERGEDETMRPARAAHRGHAVILLNQVLFDEHLARFSEIWNTAKVRICADGGANRLLAPGTRQLRPGIVLPHAICGDLDSVSAEALEWFQSQYATDLQKSVQLLEDLERDPQLAREILGGDGGGDDNMTSATRDQSTAGPSLRRDMSLVIAGGLSGRLDQTVHTMHVLWQLAPGVEVQPGVEEPPAAPSTALEGANDEAATPRGGPDHGEEETRGGKLRKRTRTWVVSEDSLAFVLPKGVHQLHLPLQHFGKTCGMLPVATGAEGVRIKTQGLEWDLDGQTPSYLGGFLSTSNHLVRDVVEVTTEREFLWTVEMRSA